MAAPVTSGGETQRHCGYVVVSKRPSVQIALEWCSFSNVRSRRCPQMERPIFQPRFFCTAPLLTPTWIGGHPARCDRRNSRCEVVEDIRSRTWGLSCVAFPKGTTVDFGLRALRKKCDLNMTYDTTRQDRPLLTFNVSHDEKAAQFSMMRADCDEQVFAGCVQSVRTLWQVHREICSQPSKRSYMYASGKKKITCRRSRLLQLESE
jgi:hypothetical protein